MDMIRFSSFGEKSSPIAWHIKLNQRACRPGPPFTNMF